MKIKLRQYASPFLLVLNLALYAHPEEFKFERITTDDGLLHDTINCILQCSRGFLWIGTDNGLHRYDGYGFHVYRSNRDEPASLTDNGINDICEDSAGNIWIATAKGGLNKFDRRTETFKSYINDPDTPGTLSSNFIMSVLFDRSQKLWVGTYGNVLQQFSPELDAFVSWGRTKGKDHRLILDSVYEIFQDHVGNLWFGMNGGGLARLQPATGEVAEWSRKEDNPQSLSNNNVWTVHEDKDAFLWVGTDGGLNRYDVNAGVFRKWFHDPENEFSLSSNRIRAIHEDREGRLWVGTFDGGLNVLDREAGSFVRVQHDAQNPKSITNNSIQCIYEDRSGVLWVGTNAGLNKLVAENRPFRFMNHNPENPHSLSSSYVWPVFEDHAGDLWFGTLKGLNRMDRKTGRFEHWLSDQDDPSSLSNNAVLSISQDREGMMWIGTFGGGLNRFDPRVQRFKSWTWQPDNPHSLSNDRVYEILYDHRGQLWLATENGLNRFDHQKEIFYRWQHEPGDPQSLSYDHVTALFEDSKQRLWIGTYTGGLNLFDHETGLFRIWRHDPENASSLSHDVISGFYENPADSGRALWIGTEGGGLSHFDLTGERFYSIREKGGLRGDEVLAMVGEPGRLWVATNQGLSRVNVSGSSETWTISNFDVNKGGERFAFTSFSGLITSRKEILFGGTNGVLIFEPDEITERSYRPPLVLTDFRIFNKPVKIGQKNSPLKSHISEASEIELSYKDFDFSFEFASLDFVSPKKNRYAYKLEGFHEDWIDIGTRRFVSFTNLDAGEYTFKVKGSNSEGIWNDAGKSIRVKITPPIWETWWFRISALLGIGIILLSLHRYRLAKVREIQMIRANIAEDLHDEIASSLASVRLYSEVVGQQIPVDLKQPQELLNRIRNLSHDVTDAIGQIIWSIDPRHDKLEELVAYVEQQSRQLFTAAGITFVWRGPEKIDTVNLSPQARRMIYLILKEAFTNVLKHAGCTRVELKCRRDRNRLVFVLFDNGKGLDSKKSKKGHGLANMKKRAAAIGAELRISSERAKGTKLELQIKIT